MMQKPLAISRRRFLTTTAAATAFGPSMLRAAPSNAQLNIAFIGYGIRAYEVMSHALRQADVRLVAVCEVEGTRLAKAKEEVEKHYAEDMKSGIYKGCATYVDYRELLERDDLDAVVIMRSSARKESITITPPSANTRNTPAACWRTWARIISTSHSGRWAWMPAARSASSLRRRAIRV